MTADLERWRGLGTATVSDALDRLGIARLAEGIAPIDPRWRVAGPAFTVRMAPRGLDGGTVGDFIDLVPAGAVVVIDNGGRTDVSVWGDLLTTAAHARGVAGVVVHGACRDTWRALEIDLPLFARGRVARTGKDRVEMEAHGVPVSLGCVRVEPGDLIVADADGVAVVPPARSAEVLGAAAEIADAEESIRRALVAGESLAAARARHGYHLLQRPRRGTP